MRFFWLGGGRKKKKKSDHGKVRWGLGMVGFEPTTSCSQSRYANRTATHPAQEASSPTTGKEEGLSSMGKKRSDHPWEGRRFPPGGWEKRWVPFYGEKRKKHPSEGREDLTLWGRRRPLFNSEEGVCPSEPEGDPSFRV